MRDELEREMSFLVSELTVQVPNSKDQIRIELNQTGIKIARRNIKNLRYVDDTTLMAESKELKSFLMKEESEKVGLKLNIQKTNHGIWSHHFMGNRWGNSGNSDRLYFGGLENHCRW